MREQLLGLLAGWAHALAEHPAILIPLALLAALVYVVIVGGGIGPRLAGVGALAAGPILIVSGLITLGVCVLWAIVDAASWASGAPYLSERILMWLAPDRLPEPALRELFRIGPGERVLLPAFAAIPIALFAAGTLYALVTWMLGGMLAELLALEQKPADVLARERKQQLDAIRKAIAAGQPPPDDAPLAAVPLPDDRIGRLYKRFGHWTRPDQVEPRFLRWQVPLVRGLVLLSGVALVAAMLRDLPIPIWAGIAVLVSALWRNARTPPAPALRPAPEATPEAAPATGSTTPITEVLADRLAPAPVLAARAPRPPATAPAARALLGDVLGALGVGALWAHQAAALEAYLERRSVLLATAPGSGRRTFSDAMVLYALLADADRVLYLCPDRATARRAAEAFAGRARATHWTWNILALELGDRAGAIDPEVSTPSLVFADPEALHRKLLADQGRWREYLSSLGLVVVPGIDRHAGVPAAHLAHLLRRLDRAIHRARSASEEAALHPGEPADRVRVLATCDPGFADVGRYAERIAARPFTVIGPERDAAPIPRRTAHVVLPGADADPAGLRDLARRGGARCELEGYAPLLTDHELATAGPLAAAEVVIARLSAARYTALPYLTEHLGAADAHPVAVLWQPDREPLAEHLATTRPPPGDPRLPRGRLLVAQPRSPALERAHLRVTLAEAEVTLDQLSADFSRDQLAGALAALRDRGQLVERERALLDPRAGAVVRTRTVRLASREDVHRGISFTACGEPFELVERASGVAIAAFDGARAPSAAYPRRVLVRDGRRYLVLPAAEQDQLDRRRILCESIAEPALTAPIRRLELDVVERRHRREPTAERRLASRSGLGGAGFWLQARDVVVVEHVLGTRTFDLAARLREEVREDPPIRCEYRARATLLVFPGQPFGDLSPAALHAIVHLVRAALPAALHHDEEDLEVTTARADAGEGPRPALAFVDLHPEGAGFADAITLDLLRPVFLLSRDLLATAGDRALASWTCRAPPDQRALDAAGAARILDALLG